MRFLILLGLLVALIGPSPATAASMDRSSAILEANKLLEEELKLAIRPQVYLVLDLSASILIIKGRGVELGRLLIRAWNENGKSLAHGVYRLRARPMVTRPKAVTTDETVVPAIELQHMPDHYELLFDPGLTILVRPTEESLWLRVKNALYNGWNRIANRLGTNDPGSGVLTTQITVTFEREGARSLAWTVTDGMPLLIGPTALP